MPPAPPAAPLIPDIGDIEIPSIPDLAPVLADLDDLKFAYVPELAQLPGKMELEAALAGAKWEIENLKMQRPFLLAQKPAPPAPPAAPAPVRVRDLERKARELAKYRDNEDRTYRRGQSHLDRKEWGEALEEFQEVIDEKGARTDAALYWKAYALHKLGRSNEALTTIADLQKNHPSSRWLNDAKALSVEVKQAAGQGVSPERESDEDLKVFAINSLMQSDPERAVPLLEKLLQTSSSPRLKQRALFVLAQTNSSRAREVVAGVARGGGNPDLQVKAIEYLGIHRDPENLKLLAKIYSASNDNSVKSSILQSFMVARDKEALLNVAKSDSNPDFRRKAIHWLGTMGAAEDLAQMYAAESSPELKETIVHSLAIGNKPERLIEIAKSEKDPALRKKAIERLGIMRRDSTGDVLVSLYSGESDKGVKQAISHALFIQGNAKALVDIARKESDLNVKREIVQRLSVMKSKEATDYMLELLK